MVSSAFGGPKPHRPTPAICFPPPPRRPIPRNIPCLRGPDGLIVDFHHEVEVTNGNPMFPQLITYTYDGFTNLGYRGADSYFSASVSNATFLNLTVILICHDVGGGLRHWLAQVSATVILPSGHLLDYDTHLVASPINDLSQPGRYNDIRFPAPPHGNIVNGQSAFSQLTRWFNGSAPPIT